MGDDSTRLGRLCVQVAGAATPIPLRPAFSPDILRYNARVAPAVTAIALDMFADDEDASIALKGDTGGRTVPVSVGLNHVSTARAADSGIGHPETK